MESVSSIQEKVGLTTLHEVLNMFRLQKTGLDVPVQTYVTFCFIANNEGCSIGDIQHWVGTSYSSVSRNVSLLTDTHRSKTGGLGLVETKEDPENATRRLCYLTDKGKLLKKQVVSKMYHICKGNKE